MSPKNIIWIQTKQFEYYCHQTTVKQIVFESVSTHPKNKNDDKRFVGKQ